MTNDRSAAWSDLAAAAPNIADAGRRVLYRSGEGAGLLATVRGDAPPRIHPVNVGVVEGSLYVFLLDSAKRRDLAEDCRFALHGHQDPTEPTEFSVRGRARRVEAGALRDRVAAGWFFGVGFSLMVVVQRATYDRATGARCVDQGGDYGTATISALGCNRDLACHCLAACRLRVSALELGLRRDFGHCLHLSRLGMERQHRPHVGEQL